MSRSCSAVAVVAVATFAGMPAAARPAQAARHAALSSLGVLGISEAEAAQVRQVLLRAMAGVGSARFGRSARFVRLQRKRGDECTEQPSCLAAIARRLRIGRVVAGEVGRLGGGYIVYLRLHDRSGKQLRSISGVLRLDTNADEAARALAFQLLAPDKYVGSLQVKIDIDGAWIYLDGRRVARSPAGAIAQISVGTHALRVTHDSYRDVVRFVRIDFGQQRVVDVEMSAVPVAQRSMRLSRPTHLLTGDELPWYRQWWAVAGFGAVVLTAATVVVAMLPNEVDRDGTVVIPNR